MIVLFFNCTHLDIQYALQAGNVIEHPFHPWYSILLWNARSLFIIEIWSGQIRHTAEYKMKIRLCCGSTLIGSCTTIHSSDGENELQRQVGEKNKKAGTDEDESYIEPPSSYIFSQEYSAEAQQRVH